MARPLQAWQSFVGQQSVVNAVRQHCEGCKSKGDPLPHTLLGGRSGIGKTTLAKAIAKEMETTFHEIYASRGMKKCQIIEKLQHVEKCDIVFVDEAHSLSSDCQELLYPALDKYAIPAVDIATGKVQSTDWVTIPPFTLIAATDQPGLLCNALKQRLGMQYTLQPYCLIEMRQIVFNYARECALLLNQQAATRLAEASRGIPRKARHILNSLKATLKDTQVEITKPAIIRHLKLIGIDDHNLNDLDRRYIRAVGLADGSISINNLATIIGTDEASVMREIEPYLMDQGLITIQSRGRSLTRTGRELFAYLNTSRRN